MLVCTKLWFLLRSLFGQTEPSALLISMLFVALRNWASPPLLHISHYYNVFFGAQRLVLAFACSIGILFNLFFPTYIDYIEKTGLFFFGLLRRPIGPVKEGVCLRKATSGRKYRMARESPAAARSVVFCFVQLDPMPKSAASSFHGHEGV